ncbi:beta-xylosidase [Saccharothrix sp. S26]|uniref:beta-xylosidase n=1 Tax=Saccharothrix sp. S26 TaxID=2907215 RepID=UPI001F392FCA|nr:beta-xylosidase [Saccharothrix sp. S26]MCE6999236.1 beta-xylosidase [Saccharothrix sp. S26]
MPPGRRLLALLAASALLGTVTACSDPEASGSVPISPVEKAASPVPAPPPVPKKLTLAVDRPRESAGVVVQGVGDAPYNYAPAVMRDGGRIRAWWCSQMGIAHPGGDDILHSEGPSLDGGFSTAAPVFSGSSTSFDAMHVCDPSVIRVGGVYYMYYTGASRDDHANGSSIGVALSPDGVTWTRANQGRPIVVPANDVIRENVYGAGQQSVVHVDGWFYLMFTDTTGRASHPNGAGQYVLRARDPLFTKGLQALGDKGMEPVAATNLPRTRSVVEAFSADWMWIDAVSAFAIAHSTDAGTTVTFWNEDFTRQPFDPVLIPGVWREGPGLVRTPEGHAPVDPVDPCGRVSLDVLRATVIGGANAPTDIRHFGLDAVGMAGCATKSEASALDRFAVPSPENTVDLVVGDEVLRFERRSVAKELARAVLDERPAVVDSLPVAARVPAGAEAVRSPDGAVGLVLDGKLWVVGSVDVAVLNSSPVKAVSAEQWSRYARGGELTAP